MVFKDPQQVIAIATIASVIAIVVVSIIALFGGIFLNWLRRPKIKFKITNNPPYVVLNVRDNSTVFYFRMGVLNEGKTVAKNCHVKITSVVPEKADTKLSFEPSNLKWSSAPRDMRYRIDPRININELEDKTQLTPIFRENKDIHPNGGWEFCDLFEECNGFINFIYSGEKLDLSCYESFIVTTEIFGDNIRPKRVKFRISPLNRSSNSLGLRKVRIDRI